MIWVVLKTFARSFEGTNVYRVRHRMETFRFTLSEVRITMTAFTLPVTQCWRNHAANSGNERRNKRPTHFSFRADIG